ncbi:uncharacterized protein LOC121933133 [Sceloporus undulatus]|uniref:uncharacterized protein LOC121933133 n=1 Tax=Sceloporus undulatus TaxID=8520 RepID=UPI001C4BFEC2|nr:uncharacterized protein LOC121933133 [Sceloporus undulatus]
MAGRVQEGSRMMEDCQPPASTKAGSAEEEEELPGCEMEEGVEPWEPAGKREVTISGPPAPGGEEDADWTTSLPPPLLQGPSEPPRAWRGLCTWQCWRQQVLEHLKEEQVAESHLRIAQVTFEDVAVYFSPQEWTELTAWQKGLYWEVMKGNHELVASLVPTQGLKSDVLQRIERGEAPPSEKPPEEKLEETAAALNSASGANSPVEARRKPGVERLCSKIQPEKRGREALGTPSPAEAQPCIKLEEKPGADHTHDCRDCGLSFSQREALISHVLRIHFGEQALPFLQCEKSFGGPSSLVAHQNAHHPEQAFTCIDCQSRFVYKKEEAGQIQAQLALGKLFKCFNCRCKMALAVDQKPDLLLDGTVTFGQPDALYYSRQKAMEQVRQRAAHWTISETKAFVELWGDDRVQTALYDNYRNEVQYKRLSDKMRKMGFHRNLEQCRQRAKDLRRGFKEIKDGNLHSNRARQTMPFFALLDRFLMMSRGLVIPKACVNRAKQKGRKSRGRREESPAQQPFMLPLPPKGIGLHQLRCPDGRPYMDALGLPSYPMQKHIQNHHSQAVGLPDYQLQLPDLDSSIHEMEIPGYQLQRQDEDPPTHHALGMADFPLRLQDQDSSLSVESCQVPSHSQHQDIALTPINGLTASSNLWMEITGATPAERFTNAAAQGSLQTWHPGKAPSSSAKRMRDLRLRRRRQRAAMARVLLGANYRPNDRTVWSKTQKTDWWDNLVAGRLDSREWIRCFRMSREAVLDLVEKLRPVLQREDTNMRAAIPVDKRVALTLWKLATSDSYRSVANQFGVGVSTASVIVMEVCEAIHDVLLKHVVQLGDAHAVMGGFERVGFPNCIGVVDETHIPILCSPHGASAYINGKGLVSMVLQALVDSAGRFMDVYAGWSGGLQDSGLPWGSPLFERMEKGTFGPQTTTEIEGVTMSPILLGGPACPLRPWLMKPYANVSSGAREHFNALLRKCHTAVTYAFERLKGRWRCLLKRLDVAEKNVPLVIIACCILHNICESRHEAMQDGWEEGMDYADLPSAASESHTGNFSDAEETGEAHNVREAYCAFFEKRQQREEEL